MGVYGPDSVAYRNELGPRAALFGCGFFVVALLPVLGFFRCVLFRYSFVAGPFSISGEFRDHRCAASGIGVCTGSRQVVVGADGNAICGDY